MAGGDEQTRSLWPQSNLTEIAMLTPILTVKTSAATAQTAAVVEAVTPREQRTHAEPARISGSQSEAVLKVLETLNRHLVGSEPVPKEALIRLLDTLAKVLKFPPLSQETLRDFTRRLATSLETLPPAARLALEKQLGQRSLAISVRILAEALKGPSIIDTPRLLETFFTPATVARPATGEPEGRPAAAGAVPPESGPARPTVLPAAQPQSATPATANDPGLLQAALKKAFGDEGETAAPAVVADEGDSEQQTMKSQTPRGSAAAVAGAQRLPKANSETIPLLRAAAAFLATDSEALSLVAAIATGDIDSQTKADLEQQLGFDLSEQTGQIETPEQPTQAEPFAAEGTSGTATHENTASEIGSASRQAASAAADLLPAAADEADVRTETIQPTDMQPHRGEVEGFKGYDLGEWDLHAELEERRPIVPAAEAQAAAFEAEASRPEKTLVETLKTLVEASLPMPEGSADTAPQTLFATLAGETADMGAEALFAELQTADDMEPPPDTALATGGFAEQPELEADTRSALIDTPEEKAPSRPPHPAALEESGREAELSRLPETGIARDAIPFAMIPYLPAKTVETRSVREEEEQPSFAEDEQRDERGESDDQEHENEHHAEGHELAGEEHETATADAYDVYKRMGGLI
jgi:hypothetical protein